MSRGVGARGGVVLLAYGGLLGGTAVGVWGAALLVAGFRLEGAYGQRIGAVLVVGAVILAVGEVADRLFALLTRGPRRRVRDGWRRLLEADFDDDPFPYDTSDTFGAGLGRLMTLGFAGLVWGLVRDTAGTALGLWAGVRLAAAVGLPVTVTGFWTTALAGVVAAGLRPVAAAVLRTPFSFSRRAARANVLTVFWYAANTAGLALAAFALDAVAVAPAPAARQALLLAAVAGLVLLAPRFTLRLPLPGAASVVLIAVRALVLWAVLQAAELLHPGLRIAGFWPLVATAALMWALEWPMRLSEARAEAARQPPAPPPVDPFAHHPPFPHSPWMP
ncbi:hypothetical protein GTW40_18605 [Streptomyces sp. SID4985]|uniref:hypothetical protein n=1 Tax=Streptomyces sp. SID4985 TaxID=2690292 RepID=UPI00136CFDDD|nr:hypothetical protein [Streptomyces sp. SID4985]MYQ47041.1 hypothetical protein [Streptomyces sp. SID4985]